MKLNNLLWLAGITSAVAQEGDAQTPLSQTVALDNLRVEVTFPEYHQDKNGVQVADLVNGVDTELDIQVTNNEASEIVLGGIGGSVLEKPAKGAKEPKVFVNLTTATLGPLTIKPGATESIRHQLTGLNLAPYDFDLALVLLAQYQEQLAAIQVGPLPVSIYDPPISSLDPRLLLIELILVATVGAVGYFGVYKLLLPYLGVAPAPKKKAKKSGSSTPTSGASSGVNANGKGYDESWIPEHHLRMKKKN
uniref:ARAD1D17644p n=1 Tax=Blastobotrys adeninivorans TaxID=409370 RepID=A0A060T9V6_BLAAD